METQMAAYAQVLLFAIPVLYFFIILESIYSWKKGTQAFRSFDTIASISAGITNSLKSVLGLTFFVIGYDVLLEHLAVVQLEINWLLYVLAFLALDFATYWSHRLMHEVNFFWNKHVVHHASEEYNLSVALRQPISEIVSIFFFFMFPAALLGVPSEVIAVLTPLHFLLQFWIHTAHIGKLGILEYILVTPSQHRVHHALNDIYLDKNLSGVFCIWDRLFGTFQEELEEEPPVYGSKRQVNSWNPVRLNFSHLSLMIKDAWHCKSYRDKLRIWFMPTGWRPRDVAEKFPVRSANQHSLEKYDTDLFTGLKAWAWLQCIMANLMLVHLLFFYAEIGFPNLLLYGGFIFLGIYSYSSLMDLEKTSIWAEVVRFIFGMGLLFYFGEWFQIPELNLFMLMYLLISLLLHIHFVIKEIPILKVVKHWGKGMPGVHT
ncbi:MAG: sterol desaturase family protein [Bacteroidia bacterium]|nr:sterol desaturase family protein [Bacteroidia bacterium]